MEILLAALERDDLEEREAFLVERCGDDASLLAEVRTLLLKERQAEGFLADACSFSTLAVDAAGNSASTTADVQVLSFLRSPLGRLRDVLDECQWKSGDRIGPYRLEEELGAGGFGTVYRAQQLEPVRRQVALKLLRIGTDDSRILARFQAECQTLAVMRHVNIATVHDVGTTDRGQPYFVMELIRGLPITAHCDHERLSIEERLRLFLTACSGIGHAHLKGVLHRDVKPANVLVAVDEGDAPAAKIIDFGLARAFAEPLANEDRLTLPGQFMGTPAYASPEQALGDSRNIDVRTDIYSLGVVLYELLTGRLPHDTSRLESLSPANIQRLICEEPIRPPSAAALATAATSNSVATARQTTPSGLRRTLRGDLDWITMKALEKDPHRRYLSVQDFAADIDRHLHHEVVTAGPPSLLHLASKFVRRHRAATLLVAVVVTLSVGFAALSAYSRHYRLGELGEEVSSALHSNDLKSARAKWAALNEQAPGAEATIDLGARLARRLQAAGERVFEDALVLRRQQRDLYRAWRSESAREPFWRPAWERKQEIAHWKRLVDNPYTEHSRVDDLGRAVTLLFDGFDVATAGPTALAPEIRSSLDRIYRHRDEELSEVERVLSRVVARRKRWSAVDRTDDRPQCAVRLTSSPAGAEVFCFRFHEVGLRLLPLPFHPKTGTTSGPFVRVEQSFSATLSDFEAGDRIVTVGGQTVRTIADLSAALEDLTEDEDIPVVVRRDGAEKELRWTPFPQTRNTKMRDGYPDYQPGRVLYPFRQFGLTFEAYPLDFSAANNLGLVPTGEPLETSLPPGSYLLVFKKPGYDELRHPILVDDGMTGSRSAIALHGRLLPNNRRPSGFIQVPAGTVRTGEDPGAFQSLPAGEHFVEGFLMSRLEVSCEEWLEFVNSLELAGKLMDGGRVVASSPAVKKATNGQSIVVVPNDGKKPSFLKTEDGWKALPEHYPRASYPVRGVSHFAAREYAWWRTVQDPEQRWTYRLPTDLEWERAARGSDGRHFIWGDYLVWSFCRSARGIFPLPGSGKRGLQPFDESVFGIRDLAGSGCEHTLGVTIAGSRYRAYRGGSWGQEDAEPFRIATRNGILPNQTLSYLGVRLVAVPRHSEAPETGVEADR